MAEAEAEEASQDPGIDLDDEARRLDIRQQKQRFLLEGHLLRAEELKQHGRLDEAMAEANRALAIERDSLKAKRLVAEIGNLMGRDSGRWASVAEMLGEQHKIRLEQIQSDAQDSLDDGKLALGRGEYDAAIAELTLTLTFIRNAPYTIRWNGLDKEAETLLARAKTDRINSIERDRADAERAAHSELQAAEQSERERREAITANMIAQAIDAFERADYDKAMDFTDQALRRSPRDQQAGAIRDAAFRAGREKVRADYIVDKREEFARWREHLQELQVPWTDVITLPDPDVWRAMTELRAGRQGIDLSRKISPTEALLSVQLDQTMVRLPGIEEEESLRAVINILRDYTGLPLVVDPAAQNAVYDEGLAFNLDLENEVTVRQALNLITRQAGEEVTWTLRYDAVLITTRERARGKPVVVNHTVQDLIMGLTDFTGPRIGRLRLLEDLEDDDGGGPFGGILETRRMMEIEDLATLIEDNVAVGSWDDDGITIEPGEGFILITHSPSVQGEVRAFLEDLRRFNSSMVTIDCKFLTVGDNWIQQIGVDFRGLDNVTVSDVTNGLEDMASRGLDNGGTGSLGAGAAGPPSAGFYFDDEGDGDFRATTQNFFGTALGDALSAMGGLTFGLTLLDDAEISMLMRAVEKSSQFEIVNSQTISVHDTQRAYVMVINQKAYIQDFDVEVAQFQAVADPQINVLHQGVVLDVRPTIHQDRKYLTLEIQPTIAKVVELRTISTTLGGNTSPVDFQLPELEVQSVNTSAIIPDGGTILLGGLSSIRNIERRAEIPWIAKIPILGFFFKEEGYSDERKSLLIMIRASILDVRQAVEDKLERGY
jgi:type II secretory pathway component GspD/PulD (secretin)